eukprot:scaffold25954_cov137-Cylindrotheca_fusiformis.AAC.2
MSSTKDASRTPPDALTSRPNTELTSEEKLNKRNLKKILKQKQKIRKYQTRLQQALSRGDEVTARRARKELEEYRVHLLKDPNSILFQPGFQLDPNATPKKEKEASHIREGRLWMLKLWNKLVLKIKDPETTKQNQTEHGRELLQNMTRGTQTESMFENEQALLGYTRQKFNERAMLAFTSLDKVKKYPNLYARLMQTRNICSIGCGPGCDAVGTICFLKTCGSPQKSGTVLVDRVVLMDFVMPRWKNLVIDSLVPLLSPEYVARIETFSADVRLPFQEGMNKTFCDSLDFSSMDFVVVSYLLTETRGKWELFFHDVMKALKPGTLLLMSEPKAWQLHLFLKAYEDNIASHQWLDSSQDSLELQELEGRMGPAVVMISTR